MLGGLFNVRKLEEWQRVNVERSPRESHSPRP